MKETKTVTRNSVIIAVIALVAVIVGGAVYVDSLGHDPTYLVAFALSIVPALAVIIYQGDSQGKQNEAIQSQVNGNLSARLDTLKSDMMAHIDKTMGSNDGTTTQDAGTDSDPGQSA